MKLVSELNCHPVMLPYAFEIRESRKFSRIPDYLLNNEEHKITQ